MINMRKFQWYGPVLVIRSRGGEVLNMTVEDIPLVEKLVLR